MANMNYRTQNGRTSKRGAFLNGVWHCDCEPRVPADKFQTKNGGKNHGRWFYTCQKPQPKRCGFFLWSDDAKIREESAVLSNSRSEPVPPPQTPRKTTSEPQALLTPHSREHPGIAPKKIDFGSKTTFEKNETNVERKDSFEWPSSDEADFAEAAEQMTMPPPLETPRKNPRTAAIISPGKRTHDEMRSSGMPTWTMSIPSHDDDVFFTTPTTSNRSNGLLSPTQTPAQVSSKLVTDEWHGIPDSNSTLTAEALKILAPIPLNAAIEEQLVDLLNRHDLRTQGIVKGRDIARLAIQGKDKKIAELQARIAGLGAERETCRTVIAHLKQDIGLNASSPKKGRGKFTRRKSSPNKS